MGLIDIDIWPQLLKIVSYLIPGNLGYIKTILGEIIYEQIFK